MWPYPMPKTTQITRKHSPPVISPKTIRRGFFSTQHWTGLTSWLLVSTEVTFPQKWLEEGYFPPTVTIGSCCHPSSGSHKEDRLWLKYHFQRAVLKVDYKRHFWNRSQQRIQVSEDVFCCCASSPSHFDLWGVLGSSQVMLSAPRSCGPWRRWQGD